MGNGRVAGERSLPFRLSAPVLVLVLLLAADLAKHATLLALGPAPIVWDARQYWELGGRVADGDWLLRRDPIAYRTPGYPAMIAACRAAFGSSALAVALVLQHALAAATSLTVFWLCRRLSGRWGPALLGYAIAVACLTRPWYANALLNDTLFALLLMLHVAAAAIYLERPTTTRAAGASFLLALCILVRPVAQLLWIPLLAVTLLPARGAATAPRRPKSRFALDVAAGLAIVLASLAPWLGRNWEIYGRPFLIQLTGRSLWIVSFQGGAGAGLAPPTAGPEAQQLADLLEAARSPVDMRLAWTVSRGLRDAGLSDVEADRLMLRVSWRAVREAPGRFAWAALKRFVNFWRCVVDPYPFYGPRDGRRVAVEGQTVWRCPAADSFARRALTHTAAQSLVLNGLASSLAWLGVAGLLARPRTRRFALYLAALLLYFAIVTAVFEIPNYRYRMILEPAFIVAAVCGSAAGIKGVRYLFS